MRSDVGGGGFSERGRVGDVCTRAWVASGHGRDAQRAVASSYRCRARRAPAAPAPHTSRSARPEAPPCMRADDLSVGLTERRSHRARREAQRLPRGHVTRGYSWPCVTSLIPIFAYSSWDLSITGFQKWFLASVPTVGQVLVDLRGRAEPCRARRARLRRIWGRIFDVVPSSSTNQRYLAAQRGSSAATSPTGAVAPPPLQSHEWLWRGDWEASR